MGSNEELDKEWIEVLNELRVILPGVQVMFAFLLAARIVISPGVAAAGMA